MYYATYIVYSQKISQGGRAICDVCGKRVKGILSVVIPKEYIAKELKRRLPNYKANAKNKMVPAFDETTCGEPNCREWRH